MNFNTQEKDLQPYSRVFVHIFMFLYNGLMMARFQGPGPKLVARYDYKAKCDCEYAYINLAYRNTGRKKLSE